MRPARNWVRISVSSLVLALVAACAGTPVSPVPSPPTGAGSIPSDSAGAGGSPTATPARSPLPEAAAAEPCLAASAGGPYLKTDGTSFTCAGNELLLTGFTFYPALLGGSKAWHDPSFKGYIDHILDMGAAAGQNLIRPTDQWDRHISGQSADDPTVWANMDYLLSAAAKRGVFVVVDLSAFRWLLMSQGLDPARTDLWTAFVSKAANRYKDNPAVAFYSIAGEPTPPANAAQLKTLTDFYAATGAAIRTADPNHLISVGGFNHMEDHPEIGWWQAIDALPVNDLVAVKTYSRRDLDLIPAIAAYRRSVAKPVIDEEFGMPQGYGDGAFSGGSAYNGLSTGRGPFFESVYASGRAAGFAGFIFWNMGCEMGSTSYEVSPSTPAVWSVVVRNGAATPAVATSASGTLCP